MLDTNLNHTRAEIQGTGRFLLCDGAETVAAAVASGFEEFGGILGTELKSDTKTEPVLKPILGVMRQTDESSGVQTLGYEITTREIADARKLKYFLQAKAGQDLAQAAVAAQAADAWPFNVTPAVINRWYDVMMAGVRIRELSAFAIAGKTEGVDYILDKKLGQVRFLTALNAATTATISAPVINSAADGFMRGLVPQTNTIWRGIARLYFYDQNRKNNLVMAHEDFSYTLKMGKNFGIKHDGQSEGSITVMLAAIPGVVYHRD